MSAGVPLLAAQDIVAGYLPGVNILNGCSLTLAEGELVGVIGPNGAGKSTLLKAMFALLQVRSGTVHLRGDPITNLSAHALVSLGVGYVPQARNVFGALTVEENLEMAPTCGRGSTQSASPRWPACSRGWPNGAGRKRDRCRVASGRCWRWAGR